MQFHFCPKCGGALKNKIVEAGHPAQLVCKNKACGYVFYLNSTPAVVALITRGNKILLSKRGNAPKMGEWSLPGGFLENGEEPLKGLRREIHEELKVAVRSPRFVGIFIDTYTAEIKHVLVIFYEVTLAGRSLPKTTEEVTDIRWFRADRLPKLPFPSHKQAIAAWRKNNAR
jgi:ADP-ribose pyrophosphatase YjhB (NUDIX family)